MTVEEGKIESHECNECGGWVKCAWYAKGGGRSVQICAGCAVKLLERSERISPTEHLLQNAKSKSKI